jgi:general secretion pathway protein E
VSTTNASSHLELLDSLTAQKSEESLFLAETGYTAQDLSLCSTQEARDLLPLEQALRLGVLPLAALRVKGGTTLHFAATARSEDLRRELKFTCGSAVELSLAPKGILEDAILRAYLGSEAALKRKLRAIEGSKATRTRSIREPVTLQDVNGDAAQFLAELMQHAAVRGASDLHLCPTTQGAVIKMRVDGELLTQEESGYPIHIHDQMVARLKVLAHLDTSKRTTPQDGSFAFKIVSRTVSVRLSTIPTLNGESVVIRFLFSRELPVLRELGIEPSTQRHLETQLKRRNGLILLTGPTGSGKSTTLYAGLLEIKRSGRNVISVEDPVEIPLPGVVQVQVREDQGLNYPQAIRAVLRHDPDAILIGEIRDAPSAKIALEAATTGHITLSSLHSRSALDVIPRLRALGVSMTEVLQSLALVMNQRLLPTLCGRCKVVDLSSSRVFATTIYQRVGCPACDHSGFSGRVLVSETLILSDEETREVLSLGLTRAETLQQLPPGAFVPWGLSLEAALLKGDISTVQFEEFVDQELDG